MTSYYNYTFNYYLQEITISKAVTDRMEARPRWKRVLAAERMTQTIREHTGDRFAGCVYASRLEQVSKGETVPLSDTLAAMEDAKRRFHKEKLQ